MKKLITILLILITGLSYGQAPFQWPSMNLYRADQQAQVRNNIKYLNDRSNDSLAAILRKEMQKQLSDSLAKLIPADNVTIVVKDGKFTAVAGAVNTKPIYDSIGKVAANLATLTKKVSELEKQLYDSIDKVASKITPADTTWKKQIRDLQNSIDVLNKDLQDTKKTIPIIDVTYPVGIGMRSWEHPDIQDLLFQYQNNTLPIPSFSIGTLKGLSDIHTLEYRPTTLLPLILPVK